MYRRSVLLAFGALSLVAACRSVDVEQTTTMNAVVETVDPVSRELLLRGNGGAQSGALLSMVVSPKVQRLNEIRPGAIGYIFAGWGKSGLPPLSFGFVSLIGVLLFAPVSVWTAPIGVRLAHSMSKRKLELAFGIFLLIVSLRFALSLLGF